MDNAERHPPLDSMRTVAAEFAKHLNRVLQSPHENKNDWKHQLPELDKAFVTNSFKQYYRDKLNTVVQLGLETVGISYLLAETGVNIAAGECGIFDPTKAKGIEKNIIEQEMSLPYILPEFQRNHEKMMNTWMKEYRERYGEEPDMPKT